MNLSTRVGSIHFANPLILASGNITETPRFFLKAKEFGCAAMVTRTLREHISSERLKIPHPHLVVVDSHIVLNCESVNRRPWVDWRNRWAQVVQDSGSPLIISLSGRDITSCRNLIYSFDELSVDAYEINISCPHSGILRGDLNIDIEHLHKLLNCIRGITKTPIWIKLSYSSLLIKMALEAEKLGADAIVCTNTIGPGLLLDIKTGKPKLGIKGGAGGVSGKAIFPIALWCVSQLSQSVRIPVIGVGGIYTAEDVIQMMMVGASAVQIYTRAVLGGPKIFKEIIDGLIKFLEEHPEFHRLSDIIDIFHKDNDYQSKREHYE